MAELRCFVGIPLPTQARQRIKKLITRLDKAGLKYRWSTEEQLHITLCFLGMVEDRQLSNACDAVRQSVTGIDSFTVHCQDINAFTSLSRPRVLWVGINEGFTQLQQLHDQALTEIKKVGLNVDGRRFQAHITIGRSGKKHFEPGVELEIDQFNPVDLGEFTVDELVLYSSELEKSGPIYTPLARVSF